VVVLCNLQARNMRGIKSAGMVLCASSADHSAVEPLSVPAGVPAGERVWFGDDKAQPPPASAQRVGKKKIWEGAAPDLRTSAEGVAQWKTLAMNTSAGPITAVTLKGAAIA
jgi:tRNA-binding EMAP/Myf-like protein